MAKTPKILYMFDELPFDAQVKVVRQDLADSLASPDLDPENDKRWIEGLRASQALSDEEVLNQAFDDCWFNDYIYFANGTRATKYEELADQERYRIHDELIAQGYGTRTQFLGMNCVMVPSEKMSKPLEKSWKKLNQLAYKERTKEV